MLSRIARPLAQALRPAQARCYSSVKETTGIVGLDVVPNAREVLIGLYRKTLKELEAIPADAVYRQNVEKYTKYRLTVCEAETDLETIERKVMQGQVEELIDQAKDELSLIPKMAEWKPWVVPEGHEISYYVADDWQSWDTNKEHAK